MKPGDRVRIVKYEEPDYDFVGKEGSIPELDTIQRAVSLATGLIPVQVDGVPTPDDYSAPGWLFRADELELVTAAEAVAA
jgi:hypothetical protein